jgi:hypothetical protein
MLGPTRVFGLMNSQMSSPYFAGGSYPAGEAFGSAVALTADQAR